MRIVLLGPPGAGKGTQAALLAAHIESPHVATGDIFRANVAQGTPLGRAAQEYMDRGDLVPDEVVIAMVTDRLSEPDCQDGFLLDGFPRTVAQAEALDRRLAELDTPLDAALHFEITEEELFRRLAGRSAAPSRPPGPPWRWSDRRTLASTRPTGTPTASRCRRCRRAAGSASGGPCPRR